MSSLALPDSALDVAVSPAAPGRVSTIPSLARWALPNLASAVFAVTLVQVLVVSGGPHALFRDSDTGWHIRTGELILRTGAIPAADPFSFSRAGRPWFAWEWLADVALGASHAAAGLPGIALLGAFLIALAIAGSTALALRLGSNFFLAGAGAALLLGVTSIHWLARPHLFSWIFALAFVAAAETKKGKWALPLLAAIWANVHGSFLLGPLILCAYAMWPLALLSLLATFVNPFGWHLHQHVFEYLSNSYLMDHIAEFRSYDFHMPGAIFVELFLVVAVAGGLLAARRHDWPVVVLTVGLLQGAMYSARHLPMAAVILLPLALSRISREFTYGAEYSANLRKFDRRIVGALPATLALALCAIPAASAGFDAASFPVAAADSLSADARVFTRDQWGGYLIYRFNTRLPVFIDGRSDFHGQDFLERYATIAEAKQGWDTALDAAGITHVMIPPTQALASALRLSSGWRVARVDSVAIVFERVKS